MFNDAVIEWTALPAAGAPVALLAGQDGADLAEERRHLTEAQGFAAAVLAHAGAAPAAGVPGPRRPDHDAVHAG